MKKLIATLALFVGLNVNAGIITIETTDTNVDIGETVSVNINATGFAPFDTFDFDFDFDTSIFGYDPSTLVSDLSSGFFFDVGQVDGQGMALSFLDFFPKNGDFLVASFDLISLSAGSTSFSLGDGDFSQTDILGNVFGIAVDTSANQSVQVSTPATLGIFAIAAFAFAGFRRKA